MMVQCVVCAVAAEMSWVKPGACVRVVQVLALCAPKCIKVKSPLLLAHWQ